MTKEEIIEIINNIPLLLDGDKVFEEDSIKISIALVKAVQALNQLSYVKPCTSEYREIYMKGWTEGRRKLVDAMEKEIAI